MARVHFLSGKEKLDREIVREKMQNCSEDS